MSYMPLNSTPQLRDLCDAHSSQTSILQVPNGAPDWAVEGNYIHNMRSNYFNIGLYAPDVGERLILMKQPAHALIMLLVADVDGAPSVLLSLRTEPGLIGLTNLSTTIQSTRNNYLRQHGGKATPFIEVAADPLSFGEILYDGEHYDWGDYYIQKVKRFLIIKLHSAVAAPVGYLWVDLSTSKKLLLEDHLITNDLRVTLILMSSPPKGARCDKLGQVESAKPPKLTLSLTPCPAGLIDGRGTRISYFRTVTETREVSTWVQPLLVPETPMQICLLSAQREGERVFSIEQKTQLGLLGCHLWFPTSSPAAPAIRQIATSAEGGRFSNYLINIKLQITDSTADTVHGFRPNAKWVTWDELSSLVATPLCTSLELRMAWSLVIGSE